MDHKWVLILDKSLSHLQPPSENAKPLPAHLLHKSCSTEHPTNEIPKQDDPFNDPAYPQVWSEFHTGKPANPIALKVKLAKPKTLWHYLGKTSTEARAQYTADPAVKLNDPASNFLDSVKPLVTPTQPQPRQSYPASYPTTTRPTSFSGLQGLNKQPPNYYSDLLKSIQQEKTAGAKLGPGQHSAASLTVRATKPPSHTTTSTSKAGPTSSIAKLGSPSTGVASSRAPQAPMASMGSGMVPMSKIMEAAKNPQQSLEEIRRVSLHSSYL